MPAVPDSQLLLRVAQQDWSAFEELYDRHGDLVFSIAMAILEDAAEAEDVMQEAFLKIWDLAVEGRLPAVRRLAAWLTTVTRNKSLDRNRRKQRGHRLIEDVSAWPDLPAPAAVEMVERKEEASALRRALEDLSPEQSEVLRLSFFRGLSHREIAETLDQPLGTIKSRLRRGMLNLRDALGAFLEEAPES